MSPVHSAKDVPGPYPEVDPLPPVLNVCFQQLMEGATSKSLILM
jgi:hypothetical protein